jgi:hypothetical protein
MGTHRRLGLIGRAMLLPRPCAPHACVCDSGQPPRSSLNAPHRTGGTLIRYTHIHTCTQSQQCASVCSTYMCVCEGRGVCVCACQPVCVSVCLCVCVYVSLCVCLCVYDKRGGH